MYCPKCKFKYRPEFNTCSDCHIGLVDELLDEPILDFVDFKEITFTFNPGDTALLKSVLDAEQIQYFTQGEHIAPYYYHSLPIRFFVREDQVTEAREIIKDLDIRITSNDTNHIKEKEDEEN